MGILIALFKFDPFFWISNGVALEEALDLPRVVGSIPGVLVMVLHIPSALLIVALPLITTIKKETRWPALLMTVGGILFGIVGILMALVETDVVPVTPIDYRFAIMGLFSILLLLSVMCFTFGTIIPAKWNFDIPGIEFEDRA